MTSSRITVRLMENEDAKAFVRTLRDSIREVASADYPPEVIDGWAPEVSETSVNFTLANPENEIRIVAELEGQSLVLGRR